MGHRGRRAPSPLPQPCRGAVLMSQWSPKPATLHTRCLRCRRPLSDPDSISRGYGPECWDRVKNNLPPHGEPLTKKQSIENIFDAQAALARLRQETPARACSCGAPLGSVPLRSYDSIDGRILEGFESPQWVYISCPTCGQEIALNRLYVLPDSPARPSQRTLAEAFSL